MPVGHWTMQQLLTPNSGIRTSPDFAENSHTDSSLIIVDGLVLGCKNNL